MLSAVAGPVIRRAVRGLLEVNVYRAPGLTSPRRLSPARFALWRASGAHHDTMAQATRHLLVDQQTRPQPNTGRVLG
jgi:hypothetical protein